MIFKISLKTATCTLAFKTMQITSSLFIGVFIMGNTLASQSHQQQQSANPVCQAISETNVNCGKTPMVAFDSKQQLWAVFESAGQIYLTHSTDNGQHFSKPTAVNTIPETIYTNGENRPKIQIGKADEIYISWSKKTEGSYNGDIRFVRSLDQGKTFSAVTTINDDGLLTGHRFESLQLADDGTIFVSWIDKRDLNAKPAKVDKQDSIVGQEKQIKKESSVTPMTNYPSTAAIYYAVSTDKGDTFSPNKKLVDGSCVCCRLAMTTTQNDNQDDPQVAIFWRHVFDGNVRDHAIATLSRDDIKLPMQRATDDDWAIEACPHHGPAITQDINGLFHLVWFTAGEKRKGIYYGQYDTQGKLLKHLYSVSKKASAGHPSIISNSKYVIIVWKEFDGKNTLIYQIKSTDKGATWEPATAISTTNEGSDYPLLTLSGEEIWLSWHSDNEGLRLFLLK